MAERKASAYGGAPLRARGDLDDIARPLGCDNRITYGARTLGISLLRTGFHGSKIEV
jgi:hypothetical protein